MNSIITSMNTTTAMTILMIMVANTFMTMATNTGMDMPEKT